MPFRNSLQMISPGSSDAESSTTTSSKSSKVCSRSDRRAVRRLTASSRSGTPTATRALIPERAGQVHVREGSLRRCAAAECKLCSRVLQLQVGLPGEQRLEVDRIPEWLDRH